MLAHKTCLRGRYRFQQVIWGVVYSLISRLCILLVSKQMKIQVIWEKKKTFEIFSPPFFLVCRLNEI